MGQGQGVKARKAVDEAIKNGEWVFLQHCHLSPSFCAGYEQIFDKLNKHVHSNFRIWLSSASADYLPSIVVEKSVKINGQQTWGVKTMAINLFKRYVSDKELNECPKPE